MSDFIIEKDDGSEFPNEETPPQRDVKVFIAGKGNIIGISVIQEFFNCMGALTCKDTPILKRTKSYADAIAALVLKLVIRFMHTHPTRKRLYYEFMVIKDPRANNIATLILIQEFD